jgi:hypothetical protein
VGVVVVVVVGVEPGLVEVRPLVQTRALDFDLISQAPECTGSAPRAASTRTWTRQLSV